MTVYVVTSGEYSDYSINAMFSTPEKAQEYINAMEFCSTWEHYYMETWELDKPLSFTEIKANMYYYKGQAYTEQELENTIHASGAHYYWDGFTDEQLNKIKGVFKVPENRIKEYNDNLDEDEEPLNSELYVIENVTFSPNREVMNKIVFDRLAEYKSMINGTF